MSTTIQWTNETWNPTVGCTRTSPGCKNCYAFALHDMRHAAHQNGKDLPDQYAKPFTELQMMQDRLDKPLHWKKPRKVFVNSVSDLFHEDVPEEFINKVFAVMAIAKQHTFQVLTKRAERMFAYLKTVRDDDRDLQRFANAACEVTQSPCAAGLFDETDWPFKNVWLGVSVENQKYADQRIPYLLKTPAAIRFLSCEPLLGPVDLRHVHFENTVEIDALTGDHGVNRPLMGRSASRIHWVIVGGESGQDSRTCRTEWLQAIIRQCQVAGVPVFCKQLGANVTTTLPEHESWPGHDGPNSPVQFMGDGFGNYKVSGLQDKKGGNMAEWPEALQVRQFPA